MPRTKKTTAPGEITLPRMLELATQVGAVRISRPQDKTLYLQFTPTMLRDFVTSVQRETPATRIPDATSHRTD